MHSDREPTEEAHAELAAALRHARRREVVDCLCESGGELPLASLACQLTTGAGDSLAGTVSELHDYHLPALTDRGLIEYDPETERVALTVDLDVATTALERAESD